MKCYIVKDLFSCYENNEISEKSKLEVKQHLDECSSCKKYYEENIDKFNNHKLDKDQMAFKLIKSINRKMRIKFYIAVVVISLIFLIISGVNKYLFHEGWYPNSNDITISYEANPSTVHVVLKSKKDHRTLVTNYKDNTWVVKERLWEIIDSKPRQANIGVTFLDKNTIIDFNGNKHTITDDDVIKIKFKDKTINIKIKDIAKEFKN